MIISKTPFRISFFGGGTDYPAWCHEHGGAVLGTTIDKYCYIAVRYLPSNFDYKYRIVYSKGENINSIDEIGHPAIRECLKWAGIQQGIELMHWSDLFGKRGMGTSSAFTIGLLKALLTLIKNGAADPPWLLASIATTILQERMGEHVGYQDQYLCTYGGFNHLSFNPITNNMLKFAHTLINWSLAVEVVPNLIKLPVITKLQEHLMLFDTGISRVASRVAGEQIKLIPKKATELRMLQAMPAKAVAMLETGEILHFGELLNEAWQIKRTLSSKITNNQIDNLYAKAINAGAIGGKLLGAGGGGYILFLAEPEKQWAVRKALEGLMHVPFKFETAGSQIIYESSPQDMG